MRRKSINRPIGGLDVDSESRAIDPADYRHALNIRNSIAAANKGGAVTNVLGNLQITKYICPYNGGAFPSGRNKVIGAVEDVVNNGVIYMMWNSTGKHGIYRYYRDKTDPANPYGVVEQVMQYDFGWTRKTRITSLNIVYGDPTASGMGDLLYWCDPVPKKINLTKGNICAKKKRWQVVLPKGYEGQPLNFIVLVSNFLTNAPVAGIGVTIASGLTIAETMESLATQINAGLSTYVTAEACDCSMTITEKATNAYKIAFSITNFYIIPDNWYGTSLIDRFWDRCKWQPMQAPQPVYEQDASHEPNYVINKVFQFRLEYNYDDNEPSSLGVWSQIAINNMGCDGSTGTQYNYIDVNFNDPMLLETETLVLLKRVRLIARELNTGTDRAIVELTPCEFLDYDGTNVFAHYDFYNNLNTIAIDAATAAKLFDDVPLESGAEIMKDNRMVEGNCLTGYNAPDCVSAKWDVAIADTNTPKLWKITGRIRVLTWGLGDAEQNPNGGAPTYVQRNFYNAFPSYRKYPFWQDANPDINYVLRRGGIFHDISRTDESPGGNFPFYGGGGFGTGGGGDFGIRSGMETFYDQRIPEAGWPVYAANTSYFTISKQINVGLSTDTIGALDTSTEDKIDAIGDYLYCNGGACGDLYSTFELNVPDGVYVIRLASHWCSFGDKLAKGFAYDLYGNTYQSTSTNVWAVTDNASNFLKQKEITVTVSGGDVFIGDFIVTDLAPPFDATFESPFGTNGKNYMGWQPICGYLVNDPNGRDVNDVSFAGVPVDKSVVSYSDNRYLSDGIFTQLRVPTVELTPPLFLPKSNSDPANFDLFWDESCVTDHNGYWFGIGGALPQPDAFNAFLASSSVAVSLADCKNNNYAVISAYQVDVTGLNGVAKVIDRDTLLYTGSVSDYFSKALTPTNYTGDSNYPALIHGFIATSPQSRLTSLTIIDGEIVNSNGDGVEGVSVVFEKGSGETTDVDGDYNILAWGDMLTPNAGFFELNFNQINSDADRIVDRLIVNGNTFCYPVYPNGQIIAPITISVYGQTPPQYNINYPYLVADFIVNELNNPSVKAHKRGGNYVYGLRYYDQAGRLCSVAKAFEMYLPFITEDLNVLCVQDGYNQPTQYPVGTYIHGKPSINWYLQGQPPEWAAYYQWMRTANSIYGRYLQWVANSVTYLSAVATDSSPEITTSYQNSNAVAIKISLSNIVDYASSNPTSQIGYSFEQGDRVRIIANRDSSYINGIKDYEVVSYDAATQSIVIKNDNSIVQVQSGSLIEIFNAKTVSDNEQEIFYEVGEVFECTAPNTPNNQYGTLSGTFTNGDTYWHGRFVPINDDLTNFAAIYPIVIESASISDFYSSEASDIGRIGTIDPNFKQIRRPMLLKASNQFIPSAAVNGLSSFEALNEKELDRSNGAIQRLFQINQYVVAVSNVRETSNYIQVVTLQQATQGAGVLAIADQYFGTDYPHSKTLGTDFPASASINDGTIRAFHSKRSDAWQYQGDGEVAISDVRMKSYFQQLTADGVSDAISVYDRYHEEWILTVFRKYTQLTEIIARGALPGGSYSYTLSLLTGTMPALQSIVDFQYKAEDNTWVTVEGTVTAISTVEGGFTINVTVSGADRLNIGTPVNVTYSIGETVSWFNGNDAIAKKRWITFYSFAPECYTQLGSDIISFKDGKVWIHGKNPVYNNFYGVQHQTELTVVPNAEPDLTKNWYALHLENQQAAGFNWAIPVVQNENGQLSRILSNIFEKKEEFWFAMFKRDLNTSGVAVPIIDGRQLRSSSIELQMQNNSTDRFVLRDIVCEYDASARG